MYVAGLGTCLAFPSKTRYTAGVLSILNNLPSLSQLGNGAIQGDATTLSNSDVDKAVSGDKLIIFDTSATTLKRVSASGLGGGKFLGETSGGAGDIIRVHENELNTSVSIDANNN